MHNIVVQINKLSFRSQNFRLIFQTDIQFAKLSFSLTNCHLMHKISFELTCCHLVYEIAV